MSALVFQYRADLPGATAFDPGEPVVVLAYVAALVLLFRRAGQTEIGMSTCTTPSANDVVRSGE
jgi:hypothetical protein